MMPQFYIITKESCDMNDEQAKFNRLLKTISMLREPHGRSLKSMAGELDVDERTVRRYG